MEYKTKQDDVRNGKVFDRCVIDNALQNLGKKDFVNPKSVYQMKCVYHGPVRFMDKDCIIYEPKEFGELLSNDFDIFKYKLISEIERCKAYAPPNSRLHCIFGFRPDGDYLPWKRDGKMTENVGTNFTVLFYAYPAWCIEG